MRGKIDRIQGLVVVTGASSGIGLELARRAARDGVDLLLAADTPFGDAEAELKDAGALSVETLLCDLSTDDGLEQLHARIGGRPVAALVANAGEGKGASTFLDQEWHEIERPIRTNVINTIKLVHKVGRDMRARDEGRILVTGSIAGHMPGSFQLVYNSGKAFVDLFCLGLRNELKDTGVAVTCLLPGATETEFFARAGMENTRVGQMDKADPAKVAEDGWAAMLADDDQVVSGLMNKLQVLAADILPESFVAQLHRLQAQPIEPK